MNHLIKTTAARTVLVIPRWLCFPLVTWELSLKQVDQMCFPCGKIQRTDEIGTLGIRISLT